MAKIWQMALLLPMLAACGTAEGGDAPIAQIVSVVRGDIFATAEATGTLEPVRRVEVTSKASGEILRLYVDIGDEVEPGALLAEIDPRDVRNAANQANADIGVAEARISIATAQVARSRELLESGVISAQEHESRTLEFANAQASLVKARTNAQLAQLRLEDVTIRAPMAGTSIEKNVEEGQVIQSSGQNVSSGTTLMVMADLDVVQVRTFVKEGDLGEIMEGMTTTVMVDAHPDRTFVGVVDQIEPQAVVQQNVTLFPLIVRLDNRARLLRPGMNTAVEIQTGMAAGALLIPNNSVIMPQDAEPAALALGLDADAVDMRSLFAGGGGMGSMFAGARPGQREGSSDGPRDPEALRAQMPGEGSPGNPSEMQRGQSGQGAGMREGRGPREGGRTRGGGFGMGRPAPGNTMGAAQVEPAVVFVVGEGGVLEPRMVMIGLTDWDYTEVVTGLDEGDQVALIGLAQLQVQREEYLERMRSRGGNPFGGGMRGGMRGGGMAH
jgi:HlyD family secretion protein